MPIVSPVKSDPAMVLRPSAADQYLKQLAFAILYWSGVVVLESSQVFVSDAARGHILPSTHYLAWAIFNWFALALLTPLIYELGRRYPITGPSWARHIFFPHAIACLVCIVAQTIGRGIAGWLYTLNHASPASPIGRYRVDGQARNAGLAYWIIVLAAGFANLREEMRRRRLIRHGLRHASPLRNDCACRSQPHFLFNTLQAAITLVQEDPQAAEDDMRVSAGYCASRSTRWIRTRPLARELEFLDLYIGIQQRRFGERLSVDIHTDPATLNLLVPTLILQPLVENAIRHGIGEAQGERDCIEIFASQQGVGLQIEVWNTNSIVDETSERLFQRGVGLRNTRARLENLYGPAASLIFRPLARGGAAAIIFVPVRPSPQIEPRPTAEAVL